MRKRRRNNMRKRRKRILVLFAVYLVSCLLFTSLSFGQEMPKPGDVIDKSNYKSYKHLFPEELATAFETGFNGILAPISMKVVGSTQISTPKIYQEYSAKNKGKYSLDARGDITPTFNAEGLPFPDLKASDKDFPIKFMWNYNFRYFFDDDFDKSTGGSYTKRRGEPVIWNVSEQSVVYFKNRMVLDPKPNLENPVGLYKAHVFHTLLPESGRNTITLSYRFVDLSKPDSVYVYLPSMRRVLRAEAGQRSTPVLGSTQALDDFYGFDGRIPEFTYTLVGEQRALVLATNTKFTPEMARNWKKGEEPWPQGDFEIRDVYVIDIKAKSSKYPQSRKRCYIDKETFNSYYTMAWDRAERLWKVLVFGYKPYPLPGGDQAQFLQFAGSADIQFGMVSSFPADSFYIGKINNNHFTYNDVSPASLIKRGR